MKPDAHAYGRRLVVLSAKPFLSPAEQRELAHVAATLSPDGCYRAAKKRNANHLVGHALFTALGPEAITAVWRQELSENRARVDELLGAVIEVGTALASSSTPYAVIESGATLALGALAAEAYASSDIDLLVSAPDLHVAAETLHRFGFRQLPVGTRPKARTVFQRERTGLPIRIEVATEPFERVLVPLEGKDPSSDWLSRASSKLTGGQVAVLEPSDALVLACVHASLHLYVRPPGIRLFVDLDRTARLHSLDWTAAVEESRRISVAERFTISLHLARTLLDTPLGCPVPATAKSQGACALVAALGSPTEGTTSRLALPLLELLSADSTLRALQLAFIPPTEWLRRRQHNAGPDAGPLGLHLDRWRSLLLPRR